MLAIHFTFISNIFAFIQKVKIHFNTFKFYSARNNEN
jgi:hypothetical protein